MALALKWIGSTSFLHPVIRSPEGTIHFSPLHSSKLLRLFRKPLACLRIQRSQFRKQFARLRIQRTLFRKQFACLRIQRRQFRKQFALLRIQRTQFRKQFACLQIQWRQFRKQFACLRIQRRHIERVTRSHPLNKLTVLPFILIINVCKGLARFPV